MAKLTITSDNEHFTTIVIDTNDYNLYLPTRLVGKDAEQLEEDMCTAVNEALAFEKNARRG